MGSFHGQVTWLMEEGKAVDVSTWTSARPWTHLPRHLLAELLPTLGQGHSSLG